MWMLPAPMPDQPGNGFQDQGLAGTGRPHEREKFTRCNLKAHILQAESPKTQAQSGNTDHAPSLSEGDKTRSAKKKSRLTTMRITGRWHEYFRP